MKFTRPERGCLYTVSGPSGSGKTSLCISLLDALPSLHLSVSCTTRQKRSGEIEAEAYHFMSEADFQARVEQGEFLEHALVHGNFYGTRSSDIESMLVGGQDVLLEIDWQGASQVAEKITDVCRVFILPPSLGELRHRLQQRGQDNADVIERRVLAAREESRHEDEAEFRIINVDFEQSLDDLKSIVRAHRLRGQLIREVETSS